MALEAWPIGTSTADAFGVASEWNDIAETNELTFVIEFGEPQGGAQMMETEAPLTRVSQIAGQRMMPVMMQVQSMTAVRLTQAAVRPMMEPPMMEPQTTEPQTAEPPMAEPQTMEQLTMVHPTTEEKSQVE